MKATLLLVAATIACCSAHMCLLFPHQRGTANDLNTKGMQYATTNMFTQAFDFAGNHIVYIIVKYVSQLCRSIEAASARG